jgi:hypothetical protein
VDYKALNGWMNWKGDGSNCYLIMVLSLHLCGGTEESHDKPVSQMRIEASTSWIWAYSIAQSGKSALQIRGTYGLSAVVSENKPSKKPATSRPWRWRWYIPLKHWRTTRLHRITFHKTVLVIVTARRTLNLCWVVLFIIKIQTSELFF